MSKSEKIKTVNVIEYADDTILSVHSFKENKTGNKEAEELFSSMVIENDGDPVKMNDYLDDGVYTGHGYSVYIVHSN